MTDTVDAPMTETGRTPKRKIEWFTARDSVNFYDSDIQTPIQVNNDAHEQVDMSLLSAGNRIRVLFRDPSPTGFSLIHIWFGAHFPLPRHTHNVDCLYYVIKGELHMGRKIVGAGDGLYIPAERPYAYKAGPDGVELLEFRCSTSFNVNILDQSVERWRSFTAVAEAMSEVWAQTRPAD